MDFFFVSETLYKSVKRKEKYACSLFYMKINIKYPFIH